MAIATREGFAVDMGRNTDDYAKFQYSVRAWNRCALLVYNDLAFTVFSTEADAPDRWHLTERMEPPG